MKYDFAGMCSDQLFNLEKKLKSINKAFVKEYKLAMNVINDSNANEHRGETFQEIEDILRDQIAKSVILYTESLNKVQRVLSKYL